MPLLGDEVADVDRFRVALLLQLPEEVSKLVHILYFETVTKK